jgi:hypothetical protein
MSSRKALCVGINQFKNLPGAALQGCVNDAKDMSLLLRQFLGFRPAEITSLYDAQATKKNIVAELNAMVKGAKAGKYTYLVFSLSSHGTQVPDLSGDEPDCADEAFCCHDLAQSGSQWNTNTLILDDELNDLFVQLPPNVLLEVYLDTCHSGTGLKAVDMLLSRRPRYLPPPSLKVFKKLDGRHSRGLARALQEKGAVHHILWTGCRADQTSADANIAGGWHGAFTYYFCKEVRACKNRLSRQDILAKVRADLVAGGYTQTPQLECEATKRRAKLA